MFAPGGVWNDTGLPRVQSDVRVDVTATAAANIARKGGTAVVDLLEPFG